MNDLRAELTESVDEAEWNWLIPHAEREAVVVVTQNLNLVEVGEAIANDNISSVQNWIRQQMIYKPSPHQISDWNNNDSKRFKALIVQPYVLIQECIAA
mgnify:CR=1 FL=1